LFVYFFFQAEDGIRDRNVTGVQTCALPIWLGMRWRGETRVASPGHRVILDRSGRGQAVLLAAISKSPALSLSRRPRVQAALRSADSLSIASRSATVSGSVCSVTLLASFS